MIYYLGIYADLTISSVSLKNGESDKLVMKPKVTAYY